MSGSGKVPPKDKKPSLVAIARAQASPNAPVPSTSTTSAVTGRPRNVTHLSNTATTFTAQDSQPPLSGPSSASAGGNGAGTSAPARASGTPYTSQTISSGSARSTPTLSEGTGTPAPSFPVQKLKFKPKIPIRRVKAEPDVKPDVSSLAPTRGSMRGRGRGMGQRGRGMTHSVSIAAGPFGGPRPATAGGSGPRFAAAAPPPRLAHTQEDAEVYSDDEENDRRGIIDIDQVSGLDENAPTSLWRDKASHQGKAKAKAKAKAKQEKDKRERDKGKSRERSRHLEGGMEVDVPHPAQVLGVKAEPLSPEVRTTRLPREDDEMRSEDEEQDRDESGQRITPRSGTLEDDDDEDVNEAQKVDLSESEDEDADDGMEGDFVQVDGYDDPSNKLFVFQFPNLFPTFHAKAPIDLTGGEAKPDIKPDIKPTMTQLKGKKKGPAPPPPTGRIGTLCVMKSGKVKMVLGDDVVLDVNPGVSATFLQQLVHLDQPNHQTQVLGEIHKNYIVTPDIDRLLGELFIRGGKTPGDAEAEREKLMAKMRREKNLVKMEMDPL